MTINALIVDDETWAMEALAGLLTLYCPEVKVVGSANSIESARRLLKKVPAELVFLDVELPGGTGFDLVDEIDLAETNIIVTTAHESYALKAFKAAAIDFLLKPLNKDELLASIERHKQRPLRGRADSKIILKENLGNTGSEVRRILIPSYNGFDVLLIDGILFCEASRNYTMFHTSENVVITASKTLREYEAILPESRFVRVHKKYLVNVRFIRKYIRGRVGTIQMTNGVELPVAESRKGALMEALQHN